MILGTQTERATGLDKLGIILQGDLRWERAPKGLAMVFSSSALALPGKVVPREASEVLMGVETGFLPHLPWQ